MNFIAHFTIFSSITWVVAVGNLDIAIAQESECARTGSSMPADRRCMEQSHLDYCNLKSNYEACLNWMEKLLSSNRTSQNLVYELYIGAAHQALAFLSNDSSIKNAHVAEAKNYYNLVLKQDSNNVDARSGLASLSDPGSDRVEQLKKILELEPASAIAGRSLATNIVRENQDTKAGYLEAATSLESVFDNMEDSLAKWNMAETIIQYFTYAESEIEVLRFTEKVTQILSPDEKRNELSRLGISSPEMVYIAPITLCYESVVLVIGSNYCFESLNILVGSIPEINPTLPLLLEYSQVISRSVNNILAQSTSLERETEDWRGTFAEQYESNIINSGDSSSGAHFTLFTLLNLGDPKKLTAISNALERDSESVQYNIALGYYLMELGRPADALIQFEKTAALESLPEHYELQLDNLIQVAKSSVVN